VLDQLVIVDYQEGAGGEFLASFISAHWGRKLSCDTQRDPDNFQKLLNSYGLTYTNWNLEFDAHFANWLAMCNQQLIKKISVPYHLYKWPHHVQKIKSHVPHARFIRINVINHLDIVMADFERKVLNCKLTIKDIHEISFLSKSSNIDKRLLVNKLKDGSLTRQDLFPNIEPHDCIIPLPSQDIEIDYGSWFIDSNRTLAAYKELCSQLGLVPNLLLLHRLINRNNKNQEDLKKYLNTI